MKKTRAQLLAEYLENVLGWNVYDRKKCCPDCGRRVFDNDNLDVYCSRCGGYLEYDIDGQLDTEYELEDALQAIEEENI